MVKGNNGRRKQKYGVSIMNYEVRRHGDNFKVYEIPTRQYVFKNNDRITCESVCDSLNSGCGFDGETPRFFSNLTMAIDIPQTV